MVDGEGNINKELMAYFQQTNPKLVNTIIQEAAKKAAEIQAQPDYDYQNLGK
jgi:hypothetical protein